VTKPSLDIEVEAYSRFSMRLLTVILKFDEVMDHFDFLVWNGIRDQSDVDDDCALPAQVPSGRPARLHDLHR
jgi:hypothetical protein